MIRKERLRQYIDNPLEHGLSRSEMMETARIAQAALSAHPAYWVTYWPDTDEECFREHSHSGPESCARRIAGEIGGYVVPVYHGQASVLIEKPTLDKLRDLMGYVENGSDTVITLYQADATMTYLVSSQYGGVRHWSEWGNSFEEAVRKAWDLHAEKDA